MSREHRLNPDSEACQRMERENDRYMAALHGQERANDFRTIANMETYGGGFVCALAGAARRADADNLARIKQAFPEYWAQYSGMGPLKRS